MSNDLVKVRELAAWGLDEYAYRPLNLNHSLPARNRHALAERMSFCEGPVLLPCETAGLQEALSAQARREDLRDEMRGLEWSLSIVSLKHLLAFQRRLFLSPNQDRMSSPAFGNWEALLSICFGSPRPVRCEQVHDLSTHTLVLRSSNPNLHLKTTGDPKRPIVVHAGSSFFEVACFRDRWFLRDGYHRAFAFLRAGIFEVPAVIVQARTLDELGAAQPWFFSEQTLFSKDSPRVTDFLDERLTLDYERPPLVKTLRITMEETLAPALLTGEQI